MCQFEVDPFAGIVKPALNSLALNFYSVPYKRMRRSVSRSLLFAHYNVVLSSNKTLFILCGKELFDKFCKPLNSSKS